MESKEIREEFYRIREEFYRLGIGALMPDAFADHVRSQKGRSVEECLDDPLPIAIRTIKIPEAYDLAERYERTRAYEPSLPSETPTTSFEIHARTWRELGPPTELFENVPGDFDIYPSGVLIEGDVALVICDT